MTQQEYDAELGITGEPMGLYQLVPGIIGLIILGLIAYSLFF